MTSRKIDVGSIAEQTLEDIDSFEQTITTMENPLHEAIPKLTKSRKFEFFDEFTEFPMMTEERSQRDLLAVLLGLTTMFLKVTHRLHLGM